MSSNSGSTAGLTGSPSGPHQIFILVNDIRVGPFLTDEVTGAEIKSKAGLALTSDLFEKRGHELIPIENSQQIKIHENEIFVDLPPTPVSR
jgi:hypothetical protein